MREWLHQKRLLVVGWLRREWLWVAIPAVALALLAMWKVPQWLAQAYRAKFSSEKLDKLDPKDFVQFETNAAAVENNARLTIAQIFGGIGLLVGLFLTWRNIKITEDGKITERFSKAVEMLGSKGSDNIDVRLGGIYVLEHLARDSQEDHWTVMEILTAFLRARAKQNPHRPKEPSDTAPPSPEPLSPDIQAVLTVIGRRKWTDRETPRQRLDLHDTFLEEANLIGANLARANLRGASLCGADLYGADLDDADLFKANLFEANLIKANLIGTYLGEANLSEANLSEANLSEANFIGADLDGAILNNANLFNANLNAANLSDAELNKANLREARDLTSQQLLSAIYDEDTKLSPDLEAQLKEMKEQQERL